MAKYRITQVISKNGETCNNRYACQNSAPRKSRRNLIRRN